MLTIKSRLMRFDIYPKIVPCGTAVTFTVRLLDPDILKIKCRVDIASINSYPDSLVASNVKISEIPAPEKGFRFTAVLPCEDEYHVRIIDEATGKKVVSLPVYALEPDLLARTPLVGDLHAHTLYSDGREGPAFVAAEYRGAGFDFLSITDHRRYEPSQMAIDAYRDLDLPFRLYPGEEVHTPVTFIHLINFASDVSVNAVSHEKKDLASWRDKTPDPEWTGMINRYAAELAAAGKIPDGANPLVVAELMKTSELVRGGGGMCIYVHPHWLNNVRNVPDSLSRFILGNHLCDAFELLGGQSWQENQTQIALYNQLSSEGIKIPVVGSSDSHGTLMVNAGDENEPYHMFTEERTIVFARSNTREDIINAVKELNSLAVLKYRGQYPAVYGGSYRLTQYALFLLEQYYPLRDALYFEEGRLMHEYIAGTPGARERLLRTVADNRYFESKYIFRG